MEQELENVIKRLEKIEYLLEQLASKPAAGSPKGKLLSMKQAAEYLQLSRSRIYSLIYEKLLQPVQKQRGSKIFFTAAELDNYLKQGNDP